MNETKTFTHPTYGTLRSILLDEIPYFSTRDLSKLLGYTSNNVTKMVRGNLSREAVLPNDSNYTRISTVIPTEAVIQVLETSGKEQVPEIKVWFEDEVIPYFLLDTAQEPQETVEQQQEAQHETQQETEPESKKENEATRIVPFLFENESTVRCLTIDDEPWFVGKDVAKTLGYKDTVNALKCHVETEDKRGWRFATPYETEDRRGYRFGTPSGTQEMTIINESGLYSLIFGSKLDSAKRFKRWVTAEVLPSLRKNGTYAMPGAVQDSNTSLSDIANSLQQIASSFAAITSLITNQPAKTQTVQAKASLPPRETISITEIAKILNVSPHTIGKLANVHKLKTPENGIPSPFCNNGYSGTTFRFFPFMVEVFRGLIQKDQLSVF